MVYLFYLFTHNIHYLEFRNKNFVDKKQKRTPFSFVYNAWGSFFAILIYLFTSKSPFSFHTIAPIGIILLIVASLFYGGFERLQFYARKTIDASTITILFRLSPVITFVTSIIFLHENFTLSKIIGMLCIITATFIIAYKNMKLSLNKNFLLAIICASLLGVAWTVDKNATQYVPNELYSLIIWFLPLVVIYAPYIPTTALVKEFRIGSWKMILLAFLNVLGFYIQLKALSLADASKVIPIINTNSVFVVLGGIYLLKERDNIGKKIIAGLLATVGVFFLR